MYEPGREYSCLLPRACQSTSFDESLLLGHRTSAGKREPSPQHSNLVGISSGGAGLIRGPCVCRRWRGSGPGCLSLATRPAPSTNVCRHRTTRWRRGWGAVITTPWARRARQATSRCAIAISFRTRTHATVSYCRPRSLRIRSGRSGWLQQRWGRHGWWWRRRRWWHGRGLWKTSQLLSHRRRRVARRLRPARPQG